MHCYQKDFEKFVLKDSKLRLVFWIHIRTFLTVPEVLRKLWYIGPPKKINY